MNSCGNSWFGRATSWDSSELSSACWKDEHFVSAGERKMASPHRWTSLFPDGSRSRRFVEERSRSGPTTRPGSGSECGINRKVQGAPAPGRAAARVPTDRFWECSECWIAWMAPVFRKRTFAGPRLWPAQVAIALRSDSQSSSCGSTSPPRRIVNGTRAGIELTAPVAGVRQTLRHPRCRHDAGHRRSRWPCNTIPGWKPWCCRSVE